MPSHFWHNLDVWPMTPNGKPSIRSPKARYAGMHVLMLALFLGGLSIAVLQAAEPATISFTLDFPNSSPEHYSISVQSDGKSHYESSGKISADSDERDTYQAEFIFSDSTRSRIFELAAQAHYFSGKVDSGNKKLAFTGAKKLVYKDG